MAFSLAIHRAAWCCEMCLLSASHYSAGHAESSSGSRDSWDRF
jgi:hypothetical protein